MQDKNAENGAAQVAHRWGMQRLIEPEKWSTLALAKRGYEMK